MDIEYDEKSEDSMVFNHEKETCETCKKKDKDYVEVTNKSDDGKVFVPRTKPRYKLR